MVRVYVSSTVTDLKAERQAVMDWLVAAQHQVVHSYRPDGDTVRDSCLADVDTCDVYVLIVGHRYGFQPPEDNPEGLSITQLEFRRAGQAGKPRIALLRTSISDISLSDVGDPRRLALVLAFRDEVAAAVRAAEFGDLRGLVQGLSTGVQAGLGKVQAEAARESAAWAARGRSPDAGVARPRGMVRVGKANPRRLGVHAAIRVPGVAEEILPEYVSRDSDAGELGLRAGVAAAAERGGFVLLVGGSSVGKTRCAVEAVTAVVPDWWLVHPGGAAEVAALAAEPAPRMVVWLDELQRYLGGEHGLSGGMVRALLNDPDPVVLIATLWSDLYTAYATPPVRGGLDVYMREREVVDLATVVRISPEFSAAEQGRAHLAAGRDGRLAIALDTAGYGLTQTLAAAPQLVARWADAKTSHPYAWAVLTAALDTARLGAGALLTAGLLRAAAVDYCTSQQQAEAPDDWFEQAMAYATAKLHGAVAALSPAGAGMGQVAGYTVADYLIQHADRERRRIRVPASTWNAILSHLHDPADATRLAESARSRLLYGCAIPLYRHAADTGDQYAARQLAGLLANRGDLDELRARADTGDQYAAERLADLLADHDLDELRARADTGDQYAARRLADLLAHRYAAKQRAGLLADRSDLDEAVQVLRDCADTGDQYTARQLARLLVDRGDLDEAVQVLRDCADTGDRYAARWLADLLTNHGGLDELRARANKGDQYAAQWLAGLLAARGDLDELKARANTGDLHAAECLAGLLVWRGDLDELKARANEGDEYAAWQLARLLANRGDLDELRARARPDDDYAARQLARLLADHGDLDELRAHADTGDQYAARRLAGLLADRGDLDGAAQVLRARADTGDQYAARRLAVLLADRGDLAELRTRADTGDQYATRRLAGLLADRGDLDGAAQVLRAHADTGDQYAARLLADLLADRGDLDELRARADTGDQPAARRLTDLLADRGDLDELRARADTGDRYAARRLAVLLADRGDLDGAAQVLRARADTGDQYAARRLAGLLADRGDLDGAAQVLRARADTGDQYATWRLADLLVDRGDLDELLARANTGDELAAARLGGLLASQARDQEAEQLRRFGLNLDGSISCAKPPLPE
jgi:hypothetical protein